MSRLLHASLDVRGALEMKRSLRGMFRTTGGLPMSNEDVRGHLLDMLQAGILRAPIGEPCKGFSHQTGCPGHEEG